MPAQSDPLNTDQNGIVTSHYYGDRGDATNGWYMPNRVFDGGDVAQGATADAAVTDPSLAGTVIALLKGLLTFLRVSAAGLGKAEDSAHASGDTGVLGLAVRRDAAAASSDTDGDYEPLQTDGTGRLRVTATRDPDGDLTATANTAEANSLVVAAAPGQLHSIVGYVKNGEAGWVQIHDATSLPANTAVPELAFYVDAATDTQPVNIPLPGHVCATGIVVAWSTTGPTLTAGAANMFVTGYHE